MSENKYLVSAIVSAYNCERFIEGCLEDLENQTIADKVEIVIVNSGSQQNEESIIKRFQEKYTNIVYLKTQERETIYAAWNRGIKEASGKYITNANSDDRHRKDAFELISGILESDCDIDLVYPNFRITHQQNESFEDSTASEFYDPPDYDRYELLFRCLPGHFPMWRKSVHNSYGYFDESLEVAGDHEFWLRISKSRNFYHINEYLGLYYRNPHGGEFRDPILTKTEAVEVINHYIDQQFMPQYSSDISIVNYPAHNAGHLKILDEGDCIPITPAPHSSPSTGRGILREDFITKIRKRQCDCSFWAADYFFSQNRRDLAKRYALKSLSYKGNYFNNYKLLLYCLLPKRLVSALRSIKNVKSF